MKLSALIHCRTFCFDFNPEFLVRPSDFTTDDIKWAREHILAATSYCDELNGRRYIVFNDNRYCVFGIVSLLDEALKIFNFSDEEIEKYSFDENGRKIKCFYGFVFHLSDKNKMELPDVLEQDYYDLLKKYVIDENIFFSKTQPGIQVDYYLEKTLQTLGMSRITDSYCVSGETVDKEMFKNLIANASCGESNNFCSNIYNLKMLEDGHFNFFTSNQNTIQRYNLKKVENEKKEQEAAGQEENIEQNVVDDSKKKDVLKVAFAVSAIILLVVIILIILL